jgi:dolichol-phosphate mannosyltransferase
MIFNQNDYGNCRVAAVILARNEERTIRDVVSGAAQFVHEVIVMDGRSKDGTTAAAAEAGATVHVDNGKGKGAATRQSLAFVDADVVVFMDADGSHDPADIPRLALPVVDGEADLCVGSRFAGGSDELSVGFAQLIRSNGNILMNIAINKRWNVSLSDTLNGFRAIRRQAAVSIGLKENRHTIEQEMVMKMLRYGYRVMNVPTHEYERKYGRSHINIWKEWPMFVWCVIINIARKDVSKGPSV